LSLLWWRRFEELRMIIKLTDETKKAVKPLNLTKNYRSHSGVLEFAATFLTQLDVCFPDSFQKLVADSGLSRGPRPGCWTCASRGRDDLRRALRLDERLIVLTRDEHARELEAWLALDPELAKTVNVLGICEAKGLEFNDVILVDFFATAPKHLQEAWNKLLNLRVRRRRHKGALRHALTPYSSTLNHTPSSKPVYYIRC
jgi:superfamily I DNA/RNA helicase